MPDNGCSQLGEADSCNAAGCNWTPADHCAGNGAACDEQSTTSCTSHGCTVQPGGCGGDHVECDKFTGSYTGCTAHSCDFLSDTCVGNHTPCEQLGFNACSDHACAWANSCRGTHSSCSTFGEASCTAHDCMWDDERNVCFGTNHGCTAHTGSTSCIAAGCQWEGGCVTPPGWAHGCEADAWWSAACIGGGCDYTDNKCGATPHACSSISLAACTSHEGCALLPQRCAGTTDNCSDHLAVDPCNLHPGCTWVSQGSCSPPGSCISPVEPTDPCQPGCVALCGD